MAQIIDLDLDWQTRLFAPTPRKKPADQFRLGNVLYITPNKFNWNFDHNTRISFKRKAFKYVVC